MAEDLEILPDVLSGEIRHWAEPFCFTCFVVCIVFSFFGAVLARNSSTVFYTQRQWLFGSPLHRPGDYYPSSWVSDVRTDL